jgi:hypothetical protein
MHSDDEFYDATVVSQIVAAFKKTLKQTAYTAMVFISNDEEILIRNHWYTYSIKKK